AESRGYPACRSIDLRGLAGVTAALAALCVVVHRGPRWPWPAVSAAVIVAAALLVLFLRRQRSAAHPLVDAGLLRNGPFVAVTLAGAAANATTVTFLVVVPLALQGRWGLPVGHAGAAFLAPALAMALAGPVAGRVPPAVAVRLLAACLCGGALALASLSRASSLPAYLALATLGGAFLGTANALTLITTQAVIRPERAGEASGVTKTIVTVAAGLWLGLNGSAVGPEAGAGAPGATGPALSTAVGALGAGVLLAAWSRNASAPAPTLRTGGEPRRSGERSRASRRRRRRPPGRARARPARRA
ncbi:MFS transporter, partial [Streptomyces lonarensis]|uniref:MFS transporter n=1 Tax=Streptomyces lonarensis TaxID=700599 RepID=UPI0030C66F62